jgi:hypothetical protein
LLDSIFKQQDYLWNTDQGKSFRAFWEFLMSEQMQKELETLLERINALPAIMEIKKEQVVDRIKTNLVEAGDKANRSNDGLIEQLRKYVEQKNLSEILTMERPLFSPPVKVAFEKATMEDGLAVANTDVLFEQFYVDIEELRK